MPAKKEEKKDTFEVETLGFRNGSDFITIDLADNTVEFNGDYPYTPDQVVACATCVVAAREIKGR